MPPKKAGGGGKGGKSDGTEGTGASGGKQAKGGTAVKVSCTELFACVS
jgi:hypothetical protein